MNLESDRECAKGLLYHKNTCVWKTARKRHHTAVSKDIYVIDSVRKYCLATGHQRHSLINCFSLETV